MGGTCGYSLNSLTSRRKQRVAYRLLKEFRAPVIFIKDWSALPFLMNSEMRMNQTEKSCSPEESHRLVQHLPTENEKRDLLKLSKKDCSDVKIVLLIMSSFINGRIKFFQQYYYRFYFVYYFNRYIVCKCDSFEVLLVITTIFQKFIVYELTSVIQSSWSCLFMFNVFVFATFGCCYTQINSLPTELY